MSGTWIFLPLSGGGGSTFYGDPVADQSLLPVLGILGEIRFAILENQFFYWSGLSWIKAPDDVINSRSVNTTGPLSGGGALSGDLTLSILQAGASQNGYLSSDDWTAFNSKQAAGNYITDVTGAAPIAVTTGTATPEVSIPQSSNAADGYLSSTDWATFNSKQDSITAGTTAQYFRGDKTFVDLTTDVVATSDGSTEAGSNTIGQALASLEPESLGVVGLGASGAWGDACATLVPAGRWVIGGTVYAIQNTANLRETVYAGIGIESAPELLSRSQTASMSSLLTGSYEFSLNLFPRPFTFAEPTIVYLHSKFTFDSGQPKHGGIIFGWRIS